MTEADIHSGKQKRIPYEYIRFEINSDERFRQLAAVFERLKADKNADRIQEYEAYLPFFDETARKHFWWPTDAELGEHQREWFATPLETRRDDPKLVKPWMFEAMIEGIANGEYVLISCRKEKEGTGILEFDTLAWPYGGTGCLETLIECFGLIPVEMFTGVEPPFSLPDLRPKTKPSDLFS